MRVTTALFLLAFLHVAYGLPANALEIEGGQIIDVVVADSGFSDTTFVTELHEGWLPEGPRSFDIDTDGNIYVLDWLGSRVQKYDKTGKWIFTFPVIFEEERSRGKLDIRDIAVDNSGDVYVTMPYSRLWNLGIRKFSSEGRFLYQIPDVAEQQSKRKEKKPAPFPVLDWLITVDRSGRVYNAGGISFQSIRVFSEGKLKTRIPHNDGYRDVGVVQKEAGNDIYFRENKYLLRTSLEDFVETGRIDTVAVLPDELRWYKFADDKMREVGWVERPLTLIGFDKDNCFYFYQTENLYGQREIGICFTYRIFKYLLKGNELVYDGKVQIDLERDKPECSEKELFRFSQQFIVSGDGTLYFLHGTVDTVKVSKIIMD
ncbi:MAG: hypothetical protein GTO24_14255 [candidate division Zixibacteria bacterium]|nr:hypothetical protein [candidate division Zixibacteria bacterium]